jgi:hypothetical protein
MILQSAHGLRCFGAPCLVAGICISRQDAPVEIVLPPGDDSLHRELCTCIRYLRHASLLKQRRKCLIKQCCQFRDEIVPRRYYPTVLIGVCLCIYVSVRPPGAQLKTPLSATASTGFLCHLTRAYRRLLSMYLSIRPLRAARRCLCVCDHFAEASRVTHEV